MEVKVYASKGTLGVLTIGCLLLAGVFLYLGIGKSGQENYDMYLLSAMFAFAFAVVFFAFMLPKGMVQNIIIGVSMLLIGIAGIFLFFISGNIGALFLLAFVAVGLLILHRTLLASPERQQEMLEESTYTRMLVVRDILYNDASGMAMVVFALVGSDGTDSSYFSYDCAPGTFQLGDRRGMDIRRLIAADNRRIIAQFNTLNISEISLQEFKELPDAAKKMFDMIDRVTTER